MASSHLQPTEDLDIMQFLKKLQMGFPKPLIVQQAAASGISAQQLEEAFSSASVSKHEAKGRNDYPLSHIFGNSVECNSNPSIDTLTFEKLISRSKALPYEFPIYNNRLEVLCSNNASRQEAVIAHARATRPLIHSSVWSLCGKFLDMKRATGSEVEQKLYATMSTSDLVDRLLVKRPLAFLTSVDRYVLKNGQNGAGKGFDVIGTMDEKAPMVLEDLISYHEMQLSSLIAVSTPTHFINSGSRGNCGKIGSPGSYEPCGIYVAQVGSRFEREERMESELCWVTDTQNTSENGYGPEGASNNRDRLNMWANFYGLDHLPTYAEALSQVDKAFLPPSPPSILSADQDELIARFIPTSQGFIDTVVYQKRMKLSVETFLAEANERGSQSAGKRAYCHVVGLGLGVWQIHPIQTEILVRCYRDTLCENHYPHISDLCFGWFGEQYCEKVFHISNGSSYQLKEGHSVNIIFSSRDPAQKFEQDDEGKLLVAQYAWDGNSWPGNEYWMGSLSASGDPAAACCSTIQELQNPDVNCEFVSGSNAHVITPAEIVAGPGTDSIAANETNAAESESGKACGVPSVIHHSKLGTAFSFDMTRLKAAIPPAAVSSE